MKKISLDHICIDITFEELFVMYFKLECQINNSKRKIIEIQKYINEDNELGLDVLIDEYKLIREKHPEKIKNFLLMNHLFNELLEEIENYDDLTNQLFTLISSKINLNKLKVLKNCDHLFAILNGKLICVNCMMSEEDLNIESSEYLEFLIKIMQAKNKFIGNLTNKDMALIEMIKINKNLESSNMLYDEDIINLRNNILFDVKKRERKI